MRKIKDFVIKNFATLETIFSIALAISLWLLVYKQNYYKTAITLSVLLLALIYLFKSLQRCEKLSYIIDWLSIRQQWLSYAILILAIGSKLTFNGNNALLIVGVLMNIISMAILTYLFAKRKIEFKLEYYIRAVIFLFLSYYAFNF